MNQRRGFTLIELLVALLLLTIVLGSIYRLLNNTQRISRAQAEHIDMQSNMRAGALMVPTELRAIGYDRVPLATADSLVPDLQDLQANSVRFRAVRSVGFICQIVGPSQLLVDTTAAGGASQLRAPVAGQDSLMIFVENSTDLTSDDRWVSRGISAITGAAAVCPATGHQGLWFTTPLAVTSPPASANDPLLYTQLTVGSPVRTFEVMEYSLYQDATGLYYLGARSVSSGASIQPVLGPLKSTNGFRLDYYDENGNAITTNTAADRRNVRAIQVTLVGVSTQNVTSNGYGAQQQAVDSVVTLVQLRNAVPR